MNIKMIAAISQNNVIGNDGELMWDLPADIHFFKQQIQNGWLLTGRKSLESIQGSEIFEGRTDVIVMTRQKNYYNNGLIVANSIEDAFSIIRQKHIKELLILGGGAVYEQWLPLASELILTIIHHHFEGDSYFPTYNPLNWQLKSKIFYFKDDQNPYNFSFNRLLRI